MNNRLLHKTLAFLTFLILPTAHGILAQPTNCPEHTTTGRDFWVAFIVNGGDQRPQHLYLYATSESAGTLTVSNPLTGWGQTVICDSGSNTSITLPDAAIPEQYSTTENKGFHITSTTDIQLIALFTQLASSGVATILPTSALGTRYIVLDYPADPNRTSNTGATVTILATEDNTTINYTPPCRLYNTPSSVIGTQVTHTFSSAGQTLTLMSRNANATLSGMEITSNKPIAVFQGNQITGVPYNTPSGDFMYEQALPVEQWGTEYVLMPTLGRSVGDRVRVVSDSACTVTLSSGSTYTLADREVQEFDISASQPCVLTADKPVSVGLCMKGSDYNAEPGDGSLVMVSPTSRSICHSLFTTISTQRIQSWYVAVATNHPSTMTLDGTSIASQFQPIGSTGYSYARLSVSMGVHSLDNSSGTFTGWAYGKGNVESYAFPLGIALDSTEVPEPYEPQTHRDTVELYDTVCQGKAYSNHGFNIDTMQTATTGLVTAWDSTVMDDTIIHYRILNLTVLPNSASEVSGRIIAGDTLVFNGDTLTLAGDYTFILTAANGCDSVLTLHLDYEAVQLSASADGVCPGEEVTLTAEGTHFYLWRSSPPDPELDNQQGQNLVTLHPEVTTTYQLIDNRSNVIASVTVGVEPPPTLCIETGRTFIDFDYPVITIHDCSIDRHHTEWLFCDGASYRGERIRRAFLHPLPDTVTVTMTTCNRYNCCADTTISFATEIRSVWFPNIFFPDGESNNRFGCSTSYKVVEFELEIYNRWGFIVWSTTDLGTPWDGTHDGEPVPQGAYVYKWFLEDIHGDRKSGIGTVTLIR